MSFSGVDHADLIQDTLDRGVVLPGAALAQIASNRARNAFFSVPRQSFQGRPINPMTMA